MLRTNIYKGDDTGGAIDWSVLIATVTGATFPVTDLPAGATRQYGIRTYDDVTGLVELGMMARCTIARDAAGNDVSEPPGGPSGIRATPLAAGAVRVAWIYLGGGGRPDPDHFAVFVTAGTAVDFTATPTAMVAMIKNSRNYTLDIPGFIDGTSYVVGVRGILGNADDGNAMVATFEAAGTGPRNAERATIEAVYKEFN